jgi:peptidoglycan/LPS O-acetylase OafA/YrhL
VHGRAGAGLYCASRSIGVFSHLQEGDIALGSIPPTVLPSVKTRLDSIRARLSTGLPASSPSVHLDALRGFAAFSVLLNHWRDAFFADYSTLPHHSPAMAAAYMATGLGHQWVIVFFVMSGYLVGGSVLRAVAAGRWSWRSYLLARLTRLYIVLLPALLLGGAIDQAGMHIPGTEPVYSGQSGMHALTVDVHATSRPGTLVGNILFLQTIALPGMHGKRVPAFGSNGPLWSLSNEFWYYMAFPLLVLLLTSGRSWRVWAGCGLGLVLLGWFVGGAILLLGIPWLMGALIAFLPPIHPNRSWPRALMIVSALAFLVGGLVLGKSRGGLSSDLILGVAVTFLVWVTLHCGTAPVNEIYSRLARRAARSSYTLYLVHLPMLILWKAMLHLPRSVSSVHTMLISMAILIAVLLYAQLVYQVCERNTERIRNWVKPFVLGNRSA